ncbi:MAG: Uma2 family endonuclease [Armatimonadetes bacterium]|nr:Uma2 family endonuclease [Armatimonadota bacterium]
MTVQIPEKTPGVVLTDSGPLRMTYEAYLDWLDEDKHAEWVNGEVITHSPVSRMHATVKGLLLSSLRVFVEDRDLGEVFDEPFLMKIGPDSPGRMPDILFVAKENLSRVKDNLLEGPADLAVEIISPDSRGRDRGDKHYEYERGGIQEYWLIDPERQVAEFYHLGEDGRYALAALDAQGRFYSAVLAGLWIMPAWLWRRPLPTVREVLRAWEQQQAKSAAIS